MRHWGVLLLLIILCSATGNAARIYGTVYDFELNEVKSAEVVVNTTPNQAMITKNGTYSFEVSNGVYVIEARQYKNSVAAYASENITIRENGGYVIDLILFPDIDEADENAYPIDVDENFFDTGLNWSAYLLVALAAAAGFYAWQRKKKKNVAVENISFRDADNANIDSIVKIIKKEGGRATQKEIRKQIPLSEAKISLMIAELEHKGVVEKIKKGRGNIIILKK